MTKKRKLSNFELPAIARGALKRLKKNHGLNFTASVTRGVINLEKELNATKGGAS